jgi:hypothetical protein
MNADQVRAIVAKQFPQAMQSPLAQLFGNVVARDEADRAIKFARLQAVMPPTKDDLLNNPNWVAEMGDISRRALEDLAEDQAERVAALFMRQDAREHARQCIEACEAAGIEYDEETLGHNIESNFPDLSANVCDNIAHAAIATFRVCKDQ